jgi:hypothetical protein
MARTFKTLLLGIIASVPLTSFTPAPLAQTTLYINRTPAPFVFKEDKLAFDTDASCQEQSAADAKQGLNALRQVYHDTLGYAEAPEVRLKGHYFCSESAYEAYKRRLGATSASGTGFFSPRYQEIVVMSHAPHQGRQTLMHEASHALLRSQKAVYSKWLNEGLAEYFEGASWDEHTGFQIQPQPLKDERVKALYRKGKLPTLAAYLKLSDSQWQGLQSPVPVGSTIAWSLVYYLMENPQYHGVIRTLIADQQQGRSSVESLSQHYPGGLPRLEQDWHRFILAQRRVHNWQGFA